MLKSHGYNNGKFAQVIICQVQIPKLPQTSKIIFAVIYSSVALHTERYKLDLAKYRHFGINKSLRQFYEGLFGTWQKLLPTLVNWAIFHGSKCANKDNYTSHPITLDAGLVLQHWGLVFG